MKMLRTQPPGSSSRRLSFTTKEQRATTSFRALVLSVMLCSVGSPLNVAEAASSAEPQLAAHGWTTNITHDETTTLKQKLAALSHEEKGEICTTHIRTKILGDDENFDVRGEVLQKMNLLAAEGKIPHRFYADRSVLGCFAYLKDLVTERKLSLWSKKLTKTNDGRLQLTNTIVQDESPLKIAFLLLGAVQDRLEPDTAGWVGPVQSGRGDWYIFHKRDPEDNDYTRLQEWKSTESARRLLLRRIPLPKDKSRAQQRNERRRNKRKRGRVDLSPLSSGSERDSGEDEDEEDRRGEQEGKRPRHTVQTEGGSSHAHPGLLYPQEPLLVPPQQQLYGAHFQHFVPGGPPAPPHMVVPPHYQPPPSSQHFYNSPGCLYYPPPGAAAWSAPPAPGGSPPEHALYENWWSPAAQGPPPPTGDPAGVHTAGTSPGSSNKPGSSSDVPPRRPAGDLPHVDTSGDKPTHEPKIGTSTLNSSQLVQEDQKARAAKAEEQRRRLAWKKVEAGVRKGTSLPPFPPNEAPFHAFPPANLVGGVVGDYPRPAGPAPRRTENTEPPLIQHPPEDDLAGRKKRARVLLPLPGGKVFDPDAKKAAHDQAASEAV